MIFKGEDSGWLQHGLFQLVRRVQDKVRSQRVLSLFCYVVENHFEYLFDYIF